MVSFQFQKVDASQSETIMALARKIWLPTFAPYFTSKELESLFSGMYGYEPLKDWFAMEGNHMYIVKSEKGKHGYFAFALKDSKFWLDKIYVDTNLQGTGLGKKISEFIEQKAKELNFDSLSLRVNRRNKNAIDFYIHGGFVIEESIDFQGPNGFVYDDYIMKKDLN